MQFDAVGKLGRDRLIRRYGRENVFYFEKKVEIDFYVPEEKLAIQVSLQVLDQIDTREREIGAFVKLKNLLVMQPAY